MRQPELRDAKHAGAVAQARGIRRLALVVTRALTIYGMAAWVYVALVALVHPRTLSLQLTHFSSWPHEDTFGELSFAISFVSYVTHSLLLPSASSDRLE
jgi:hypothetical protein